MERPRSPRSAPNAEPVDVLHRRGRLSPSTHPQARERLGLPAVHMIRRGPDRRAGRDDEKTKARGGLGFFWVAGGG